MIVDYTNNLLENVHRDILPPEPGRSFLIRGDYEYWHYGCDGFNDKGWGCGYRTLQTICSWVIKNQKLDQSVPSIGRVQEILVTLEDKERSFIRSREWIGSFEKSIKNILLHAEYSEFSIYVSNTASDIYRPGDPYYVYTPRPHRVCLVLNYLYDVLSKIIHVPSGKQLSDQIAVIKTHFENYASPIMMGGDRDCSSKCIVGVHEGVENTYMLIVDPHFVGQAKNNEQLQSQHWVKWQNLKDFIDSSFYNLCLPQIKGPMK